MRCGALILPSTSVRTNGLCMPCSTGTRAAIDAARQQRIAAREYERTNPFRRLWLSLVSRINDSASAFEALSEAEKLSFALGLVELELYNGGFEQYFHNSSAAYFNEAVRGLERMGAVQTLSLLEEAKRVVFLQFPVPIDTAERRGRLRARIDANPDVSRKLEELERQYCADPDGLSDRMERFARQSGLVP